MKLFLPGAGVRMVSALKSVPGVEEVVISIDDPFAAGCFLADRAYLLPRFNEPGFAEGVLAIHEKERFDVCLPVLDSALLFFARNQGLFREAAFRIAMNDPAVVELAADKIRLLEFLRACGLPVPSMCTLAEYLRRPAFPPPCFLKPRYPEDRDFGRAVYTRLEDARDVEYWGAKLAASLERFVVQPWLGGTEINVNFFCDAAGEVRSNIVLRRLAGAAGGPISRGEIIEDARFDGPVRAVAGAVRLWGSNELQAFIGADGGILFTELNARLSASVPFVAAAGADHFANTVRLLREEPVAFPARPRLLRMTQWEHPHYFEVSPARRAPGKPGGERAAGP